MTELEKRFRPANTTSTATLRFAQSVQTQRPGHGFNT